MPARILVIEDNPTNLDLMTYLLRAFGHEALTAQDGLSGLTIARTAHPDLIICDIQLPGLGGHQVAVELKQDPQTNQIPIVAVTAYAMVGDRDQLLASGFDGYLSKPIEPESFVDHVQRYLPENKRRSLAPASETVPWETGPQPQRASILCVDDNEVNLNLMRTLLQPMGYRVITTDTIERALMLARQSRPDLIITDVHLAHRTGYDLARWLKKDAELRSIPCIVISSTNTDSDAADQAAAAGAELFLLRPIEPHDLLSEIEQSLARNQKAV